MSFDQPDWVVDAVFYQIFPDRFARNSQSDSSLQFEDWDTAPTPHGFKGGDLEGVIQRLDYLLELGINAIYLTPIFTSASNHRYHTYDFLTVDPLLGGDAALRRLLDEAHDRGIRVILDGVFNHASRGFWQFHHVLENGIASPFHDWFYFDEARLNGKLPFLPYPDEDAAAALKEGAGSLETVGYGSWWNLPALPKFNVKTQAVRDYLFHVAEHWIQFGIDGWRLDVPHEIRDVSFWREFRQRVRRLNPDAYIVGEVWGDARRWLKGDMWDGVMNYQVTAACLGFFGGRHLDLELARQPSSFRRLQRLTGAQFASELTRLEGLYPDSITHSQLNLLDSHDMPRFLTCVRDHEPALRLAWLFLCTTPGAPCVYYGDEVGLAGGPDPDCRRSFPRDQSTWNRSLLDWYRSCIALRHQCSALRRGSRDVVYVGEHVYAAVHRLEDQAVLVAFNADEAAVEFTPAISAVDQQREWQPLLNDNAATFNQRSFSIHLPGWSAIVLQAELHG